MLLTNRRQVTIPLGTTMRLVAQGLAQGVASTPQTAMGHHMEVVAVDITNNNNIITITRKHNSSYSSREGRIKADPNPGRTKKMMICGD